MISNYECENDDFFLQNRKINISLQTNGRKKITIICGFENGDKDKCKELSKKIKKIFSTGGSIKEDGGKSVVMFQGDIRIDVVKYIKQIYGYIDDEIVISGV